MKTRSQEDAIKVYQLLKQNAAVIDFKYLEKNGQMENIHLTRKEKQDCLTRLSTSSTIKDRHNSTGLVLLHFVFSRKKV